MVWGPEFLCSPDFEVVDFDVNKKLSLVDVVSESRKGGAEVVSNVVEVSVEKGSGDEVVMNDFSLSENVVLKIENNMPHEGSTRLDNIIDVNRFSSLKKLLIVTGFVLRFARNLLKIVRKNGDLIKEETLTLNEYNEAFDLWIKNEQLYLKGQSSYAKMFVEII